MTLTFILQTRFVEGPPGGLGKKDIFSGGQEVDLMKNKEHSVHPILIIR